MWTTPACFVTSAVPICVRATAHSVRFLTPGTPTKRQTDTTRKRQVEQCEASIGLQVGRRFAVSHCVQLLTACWLSVCRCKSIGMGNASKHAVARTFRTFPNARHRNKAANRHHTKTPRRSVISPRCTRAPGQRTTTLARHAQVVATAPALATRDIAIMTAQAAAKVAGVEAQNFYYEAVAQADRDESIDAAGGSGGSRDFGTVDSVNQGRCRNLLCHITLRRRHWPRRRAREPVQRDSQSPYHAQRHNRPRIPV